MLLDRKQPRIGMKQNLSAYIDKTEALLAKAQASYSPHKINSGIIQVVISQAYEAWAGLMELKYPSPSAYWKFEIAQEMMADPSKIEQIMEKQRNEIKEYHLEYRRQAATH